MEEGNWRPIGLFQHFSFYALFAFAGVKAILRHVVRCGATGNFRTSNSTSGSFDNWFFLIDSIWCYSHLVAWGALSKSYLPSVTCKQQIRLDYTEDASMTWTFSNFLSDSGSENLALLNIENQNPGALWGVWKPSWVPEYYLVKTLTSAGASLSILSSLFCRRESKFDRK